MKPTGSTSEEQLIHIQENNKKEPQKRPNLMHGPVNLEEKAQQTPKPEATEIYQFCLHAGQNKETGNQGNFIGSTELDDAVKRKMLINLSQTRGAEIEERDKIQKMARVKPIEHMAKQKRWIGDTHL